MIARKSGREGNIVSGESANIILERWCRWIEVIMTGLRVEARQAFKVLLNL
jgi:hypothetical protein